jgi:hypothetical protein
MIYRRLLSFDILFASERFDRWWLTLGKAAHSELFAGTDQELIRNQ